MRTWGSVNFVFFKGGYGMGDAYSDECQDSIEDVEHA